jgi:glyoxylase-like metal-dependent hydrolase (beta-lactamase superfamily II)
MSAAHNGELPGSIRLIDDMHLGRPLVVGTYLLLGDEPAVVDPGPASVLPSLEAGLAANGLTFGDLRAILLTHIHLDHAGATGSLVRACPHLRVYVHQRGAPHMIAPDKLIRSATRIYGERMDELWGEFLPVPEQNITILGGGETIRLGRRMLRVFDAPGHASHHVLYLDDATGAAFVGDTTGLRMPGFRYVRPATPPPDIDLEAWRQTLDTLLGLQPTALCLTHFGPAFDAERHIAEAWEHTLDWAAAVRASLEQGEDEQAAMQRLVALAEAEMGSDATDEARHQYAQAGAVTMSWHGLARYWRKKSEGA